MRTRSTFILISIFFFLLIFINWSFASIQSEEIVLTSTGRTIDEAVIKGLVEAIRQKRGVEVDSLEEIYFSLESLFMREGKEDFIKDTLRDDVIHEVSLHTKGLIEKYEILSQNKIGNKIWGIKLKVFVPTYSKEKTDKKSTLAIMPIKPIKRFQQTQGIDVEEIARLLSRRLTTQLVQTRHYNVIDREYSSEYDKEIQLIMSGGFPIAEMARLEEQLGADYLIIGTLSDVNSCLKYQEFSGAIITKCQIFVSLDVRAVEFATRQVLSAETIDVSLNRVIDSSGAKKALVGTMARFFNIPLDHVISTGGSSEKITQIPGTIISQLVDEVIDKLNSGFLDVLMPIRVLDIQKNVVYLNQGGTRVQKGERFNIMGAHRSVKDLGSGAVIRIEGAKLAEIVIDEVMEEYSIAEIVSGERGMIKAGLKCKRLPTIKEKKNK